MLRGVQLLVVIIDLVAVLEEVFRCFSLLNSHIFMCLKIKVKVGKYYQENVLKV